MCDEFGFPHNLKGVHATRIGKVVRDLKDADAQPHEIADRAARYRAKWPDAACTPEALAKHWFHFAPPKKKVQPDIQYENYRIGGGEL